MTPYAHQSTVLSYSIPRSSWWQTKWLLLWVCLFLFYGSVSSGLVPRLCLGGSPQATQSRNSSLFGSFPEATQSRNTSLFGSFPQATRSRNTSLFRSFPQATQSRNTSLFGSIPPLWNPQPSTVHSVSEPPVSAHPRGSIAVCTEKLPETVRHRKARQSQLTDSQ